MLAWEQPHQCLQTCREEWLLDSMDSIISNNIMHRQEFSRNQGMVQQINSISTEVWHLGQRQTNSTLMALVVAIHHQVIINLALLQIIELCLLVHGCLGLTLPLITQ